MTRALGTFKSGQLGLDLDEAPPSASRPPRRFFARGHMTFAEHRAGELCAEKQEERVLTWLQRWPGERFTPWQVAEALGLPITSVRRAMTNLTDRELLLHWPADRRKAGPYGAKSATWSAS